MARIVVLDESELDAKLDAIIDRIADRVIARMRAEQRSNLPAKATIAEAARTLRISTRQVRRRIASGTIRATKIGTEAHSRVLIDRAELERIANGVAASAAHGGARATNRTRARTTR